MYIAEVIYINKKITSVFVPSLRDAQLFAIDWSVNKNFYIGNKVPFGELNIHVYDISKPCGHAHQDIPMIFF